MKELIKYVAEDGTEFSTKENCLDYEQNGMVEKQLQTFIEGNLLSTYDEDFHTSLYEVHNIKEFIIQYIDVLNEIIFTKEKIDAMFVNILDECPIDKDLNDVCKLFFTKGIKKRSML